MKTTTAKNHAQTKAAIAQVEDHNSPGPLDCALRDARDSIARIAKGGKVTSDTLLPDLSEYGFTDNRAVGVIMRKLINSGEIKKIPGEYRKSQRRGNHLTPRQVYSV